MKKTIAVFFGGRSPEHDISVITALSAIIKPLELTQKYTVIPVYITKTGNWISDDKLKAIKLYQSAGFNDFINKAKPVSLKFDGGLILQSGRRELRVDIGFPAMHGSYGEDGSLMGVLRMAGIPFVGADLASSVVAMDKVLAKQVIEANNIATAKFIFFTRDDFAQDPKSIIKNAVGKLRFPLFVKPAHLGSSIGITQVKTTDELHNAIEVAAYYDEKIIVEEAVGNLIEVTVPIIGNDRPQTALVERPLAQGNEFFDFDTKYIHGGKKNGGKGKTTGAQGYSQLPAELPDNLYEQAQATALAVYKAVGITGMSRIDLLIDAKAKKIYFNEINPLPGSLYAHNWRAAGISGVDLVEKVIQFAEERFNEQQKLTTTFDSSFLKQF